MSSHRQALLTQMQHTSLITCDIAVAQNEESDRFISLLSFKSQDLYWMLSFKLSKIHQPKCIAKLGELFEIIVKEREQVFHVPFQAYKETISSM